MFAGIVVPGDINLVRIYVGVLYRGGIKRRRAVENDDFYSVLGRCMICIIGSFWN